MARPPLPAGTHGHIRFQRTAAGDAWRARAQVRDWDGRTRPVERTGRTKAAARDRLEIAVRDRVHADAPGDITPDTRITSVAEAWFTRVIGEGKAATTLEKYRRILDRFIIPGVGGLRVRELSVGRCDHFQQSVSANHGPGTAKLTRTVLSGVCALACRHGALPHSPMRDVSAIRTEAKAATALTELEARQVRAYLTYDDRSVRRDIPDFVDIMLATSLRISECAAIHWPDLDLAAGSLRVRGNVVRLTGKGLVVNEYESNKLTRRTLRLPSWAIDMLRGRRSTMPGDGPVFPAPTGGLRDPSNTQADLRDAFTFAGRPGLTSHVFRKTVATLMDTRGRTARNVSDQLGHAQTAMAQNKYMGRQITDTGAADILESLAF